MKKVAAFCLLVLFPLLAQAGYVFELSEPTLPGIFIDSSLRIDKDSIKYFIKEEIKDAAGKIVDTNYHPKVVRHGEVNEQVLQELSDNYGAKVRVSANEEYEGIGQLDVDDIAIITDKNITIVNCDITTTGNIYMRSNSQITQI